MQISKRHPRLDTRLFVGLFAAGIGAIWLSAGVKADDDGNVVRTDRGTVRGIETPSMHAFLGIPYAAAPVGNLRWQPPRPHAPWNEPLDASSFGDHCPQPPSLTSRPSVTEDCLFLNVFTPRREHGRDWGGHGGEGHDGDDRDGRGDRHDGRDERGRPVMVWIFGGGLTTGESDDYDPVRLVNEGAIVVTFNYRLGVLGFLAHPALSAESPHRVSGNYGLLDQQFALRWVRRNIASFGGDPDNVTIFGLSAGGLSVHAQLASPGATGLFRRAIVQSGAYSLGQPTLADAQAFGAVVAGQAGCATAACLRALPVTTILALQDTAFPNGMLPVVDGKTLPQSIGAAFGSGLFNRVPVIEGSTHDEGRFFVGTAELATGTPLAVAAYIPAIAQALGVSLAQAAGIATFYPLDRLLVSQPGARRSNDGRHLRMQREARVRVAVAAREDLPVRVQRSARANSSRHLIELSERRLSQRGRAVPVRAPLAGTPWIEQRPGSTLERHGSLLDALRADRHAQRSGCTGVAALRRQRSVPVARGAHAPDEGGICCGSQVRALDAVGQRRAPWLLRVLAAVRD